MTKRRTISVDDDVGDVLEAAPNASEYLENLVRRQSRAVHGALRVLLAAGWHRTEIKAATECLAIMDDGHVGLAVVAAEMGRGEEVFGCASRWAVLPPRWADLTQRVTENAAEASALLSLAREGLAAPWLLDSHLVPPVLIRAEPDPRCVWVAVARHAPGFRRVCSVIQTSCGAVNATLLSEVAADDSVAFQLLFSDGATSFVTPRVEQLANPLKVAWRHQPDHT